MTISGINRKPLANNGHFRCEQGFRRDAVDGGNPLCRWSGLKGGGILVSCQATNCPEKHIEDRSTKRIRRIFSGM